MLSNILRQWSFPTFFFTQISLKQPKQLFKIPPWEDASQTAMKNQNEAQFEEKAVKYFISRNI